MVGQCCHLGGFGELLDLVPGHTSIEHPWFKASCEAKPNKYSNWYIWTDSVWDDGGQPYNQKTIRAYAQRDGNFLTNYFWSQPALNFGFANCDRDWQKSTDDPDVQALWQEFRNIMRYWLDMGCSGFRVDMAGSIIRNDPDCKEITRFWSGIREMLDTDYPDAFLISEWSHPTNAIRAGFHADFHHWFPGHYDLYRGEELRSGPGGRGTGHSFFDEEGKGDVLRFLAGYFEHFDKIAGSGYISIPVGNHDLPRINIDRDAKDLEIITAMLMTFPGPPFFYYGDEIGMRHLPDTPNKEGAYTPRVGARTPMQWDDSANAGFSAGPRENLYFPIDPASDYPNVASCEKDPESLLQKTRKLIHMRRTHRALAADADFTPLLAEENTYPFVFSRSCDGQEIIAAFNPSNAGVSVEIDYNIGQLELLAGADLDIKVANGKLQLAMPGKSYGIYTCQKG